MRRWARSDLGLLVVGAAIVLIALTALASGSDSVAARARRIEAGLRCPTCQGLSIADSPAPIAAQMRAVVVERLGAGDSDDAVRAYFVARYGRWILLDPPATGVDLALWLMPAAFIAAGSVLIAARSRRPGPGHRLPRSRGATRPPVGKLASGLAVMFIGAAIVVPAVLAIGPRLANAEITGRPAPTPGPALARLESLVAAQPTNLGALLDLADALLAAGRGSEAASRYQAALQLDPANDRALLGVAAILLDADRPDAAVAALDRVLGRSPDQPEALIMRGLARIRLDGGLSTRARADLERFVAVYPNDPRRSEVAPLLVPPSPP